MLKCVIGVVEKWKTEVVGRTKQKVRGEIQCRVDTGQQVEEGGCGAGREDPAYTSRSRPTGPNTQRVSESNTERLGEVADSQLPTALKTIFRVHWPTEWKVLMSRWIRLKIGLELNQG